MGAAWRSSTCCAIGSAAEVWELRPLPSERQRTEHGSAGHKLSGRHLVVQKTEQLMATGLDYIGNGTSMAAGAKNHPGGHRACGVGDWAAELDATANETATRRSNHLDMRA